MDLISRKAAIEALGEEPLRWNNTITEGQEWNDWKYHVNAIKSVPSVPAVPMDKLCEYLNSVIYPCIICKESPGPQCNAKREGCWKRFLTKWMEEQDAAD